MREEVLLGPAELVFLLEDLLRKQEFSLSAGPARRAPFLKVQSNKCRKLDCVCLDETRLNEAFSRFPQGRSDKSVGFSHLQQKSSKEVATFCVQLLPALCSHLENCHNHFQVQTQQAAFHLFHFFHLSINNVPCLYTGRIFSRRCCLITTALWTGLPRMLRSTS